MSYHQLVESQREYFLSGATRPLEVRKKTLTTLRNLLTENRQALVDAIYKDLHRHSGEVESGVAEIDVLLGGKLEAWGQPQKLDDVTPFNHSEDTAYLVREPFGVVLVMAPWNFPLICSLPSTHALASGNTVILKPSELAPTFSTLIAKLVPKYFDSKLFAVVEGAVAETTELLKERFDGIMYTGNPTVAKIVMAAAAKNLTPVTLELGGKNPVLVEPDADFDDAAEKIVFSKMYNAGQICISSDYVLTTAEARPKLVTALKKAFEKHSPLKENESFARIIHERHFDRLSRLINSTKGELLYEGDGGNVRDEKYIAPKVYGIEKGDAFMSEEIFGPILPILTVKNFDESIAYVKAHEKPLGAYIFTKDNAKAHRFVAETSSGGVCVNDVMKHAFLNHAPFGGVGNSGVGKIGGRWGYNAFTHEKSVLLRNGLDVNLAL